MSTEPSSKLRVLVVEDDRDALDATVEAIEVLGHWATGVSSAEIAQSRYLDGAFDVLMTDVGLPGLSGHDLVSLIGAGSARLEIIYATGAKRPENVQSTWLMKPYGIDALQSALQDASRRLAERAA